jgi:hypothetical protein
MPYCEDKQGAKQLRLSCQNMQLHIPGVDAYVQFWTVKTTQNFEKSSKIFEVKPFWGKCNLCVAKCDFFLV